MGSILDAIGNTPLVRKRFQLLHALVGGDRRRRVGRAPDDPSAVNVATSVTRHAVLGRSIMRTVAYVITFWGVVIYFLLVVSQQHH